MRRLLIRPGAIGDFIVSLPALEALRGEYTEVWCAEQNVPLAGFADRVISMGSAGLDRVGLLPDEDVRELLGRFDEILSWYGTGNPEFHASVSGFPFRFLPALPDGKCHAVEFYLEQARAMGGAVRSRYPRIECPETKRRFAVIHPFASSAAKRAPMKTFRALAARLGETMPVEWLVGPEEELAGARRFGDLYELACWLRGARVFVGNDSGISHLAAAVGTPVMALFQASDARVWAPRGVAVGYSSARP